MFIGRRRELAELEKAYNQGGFKLFVIGGPEGAGKTTLVEEFCKDKEHIFFTASRENGRANLTRFSLDIFAHYNDLLHEPFTFWDSAFKYICDKHNGRIVVVLDELGDLAERDPVFVNTLRKCIDSSLLASSVFMIITSSSTKFLQNALLGKHAPLSSKVTGSLVLDKFTLSDEIVEQLKEQVVRLSMHMDTRKVVKYSADEVIIREGEINSKMYKIISGKAVCYFGYGTDDEYPAASLKDGRSFGEYSLLTGKSGVYTVVAFTDVLALRIGGPIDMLREENTQSLQ